MTKGSDASIEPPYRLDHDPIDIDPGLGPLAGKHFDVIGYGMELISNPPDGAWVPTLFLKGAKGAETAVAIVYFHETTADGVPNWDEDRKVCYIHYPLALFESVMSILRSKEPIQFYWKDNVGKRWSGLNFTKTIPKG